MNTRISHLFATGLCIAALAVGIAYSQTSNGDPPDNDIGGNDSPNGPAGDFNGTVGTGSAYDPYTGNAERTITDLVVPETVGAYSLKWTRFYDSRGAEVGTGIPLGWRHSYQWDMNLNTGDGVGTPDGRWLDFNETNVGNSERSGGPGVVLLGDGGRLLFESVPYTVNNQSFTRFRLAQIVDPHGLITRLDYETTHHDQNGNAFYRLARITEPAGRYLQVSYSLSETGQITGVQAFDAQGNPTQSVSYTYGAFTQSGTSRTYPVLTRVDYSDGTAALYTYQNDNTSRRGSPGIPLLKTCRDVRYGGAMRDIDYLYVAGDRIRGKLKSERKWGSLETVSSLTFPAGRAAQNRVETRGDGSTRTFTYSSQGRLFSYTDFTNANPTSLTYDAGGFLHTVTDAGNHAGRQVTRYDREPNIGQLTRLTHPGGHHVDFEYTDPNNPYYLQRQSDERAAYVGDPQHSVSFDRDGNNRVWQIRYPDGATETFSYNNLGQVLTHKRRNGAFEHFEYDSKHRLYRAWNPTPNPNRSYGEPHSRLEYYESGPWADRVRIVFDPKNNWTLYEYDLDAAGQPCAGRGLVTKVGHVDNTHLSFGYDALGNLIWHENELRQRTTVNYDDYSRPVSVVPPAPAGPVTFTYEPTFGTPNPYLHTAPAVHFQTDGSGVTVENKYDRNFRVTSIAQVDGTASPPTTRFEYWPVGTLRLVRDPRNQNWTTSYTFNGRRQLETVTDALQRTTRFHRDPAGNIEWIDRPDARRITSTYDEMNRVRTFTEPLNDSANKTTTFTYWPSGRVRTVQDNNQQTTTFQYDYSDRRQYMFYPDNTFQQWDYDETNILRRHRTVGGKIQRFQPDNRNRITDTWWDPGDPSERAWFVYDAAGQLTQANNPNSTITLQYDNAGRLLTEEQNVSGLGPKTVSYGTDGAGKLTAMGIAGTDYQFAYHYDALGRLDQLLNVENTPNGPTASLWFQYFYDAASNETQRYCPMNGVAQFYSRDELGRIGSISIKKATEPRYGAPPAVPGEPIHNPVPVDPTLPQVLGVPSILAGLTNLTRSVGAPIPTVGTEISFENYQYDALSRLIDVTRNSSEGLVPRDQFTYDHSGQLTNATYTLWYGSAPRSVNYGQDALGNRSQVNDNGTAQGYSSNAAYRNQYVSAPAGAISSGVEHEVASYAGLSYGYRNDGKLARVNGNGNSYGLAYDALGRCVKRTLNGTTIYYTYDGPHAIYEWKADGTRAGWNVYGQRIDEILLRADYQVLSGGQGYFFQQNRLGSVTHLTGFSGETIEHYRYDAFGSPTTTQTFGSFNNRFKFTGREYQSAFGIYEYRERAYHPGLGRFLSEDPLGFATGDTNLFRYCGGDPVNGVDPFGLAGKKEKNYNKDGNDGSSGPNGRGQETYTSGSGAIDTISWVGSTPTGGDHIYVSPWSGGRAPNAGVPGGLSNSATGLSTSSGSGPGDGSGPGSATRDGGNGTIPNPYRASGPIIAKLAPGFDRYNLPAHAAFWEEFANQSVNFIPLGGAVRVGSGLRVAANKAPLLLGPGTRIGSHIAGDAAKRGWTSRLIDSTINNPVRTVITRDTRHLPGGGRMNDPATAYYSRRGGYVVRNDRTGDIVQVSDRTDPGWIAPWD